MIVVLRTFAIAGVGVAVFKLLHLPLPWLMGPIFACLAAALAGVKMRGIKPLNDTMRTILGVAVGATLTPAVLATFPAMWPTLLLVPIMVAVIGVIGVPYFQRFCGYDFATAYYATMPGGLQDMIVFGEEAGANVRTLSLIHATRVMVIVVALPFLLIGIWEADLSNPPGAPATSIPPVELLLMAVCAIAGWRLAKRVGLFGASILGPLIVTAALTLAGGLHNRPPAEAIWAAQFFIGMTIGTKYAGITMAEIRKDLAAGLGFCGILIVLTLIFVEAIYSLGFAPGMETLLAFAPGGQAELTVLALIVGADVAFVVAHHVLRIFVVIMGAPLAARVFRTRLAK
ncbi:MULTISPECIES: AbrB family transcriptional regulator [Marivita]|uniref:AbrB family transcriptional regulator n=1 Tax=Marivita cryptomonadis TaxID=505252 RepID=A0A9Q2NZ05_9RHOB|nr:MULTISPECIES: AbrB family transcriptional regulator [Marivita]MCR9167987.1 AbrB family transcriptional regulator [Paracoccaceae bacterium]MBM2321367.1 AbrB family transcriptional regulator [Marivita cryptomonadis]MBM2330948.1 AbrB family transcriptional regulator [Marivita cryptomonadis]MBM2340534.1 AbrB family transcriptional regulator [Marivita cryptomonadis]MBM2345196.1 AbrB family transcriptional regulator [Marivita cryptomonadis]